MKEEFYHEYLGFGRHPSTCKVIIYLHNGENLICFEDIGEGTSVTNASEQLASEIVYLKDFDPGNCRFFESYREYKTFDEIEYKWKLTTKFINHGIRHTMMWEAKDPDWKPGTDEIKNLFIN